MKDLIPAANNIIPTERRGIFQEGVDKLGRRYEKKLDDNGIYTKTEVLKTGEPKITIKKLNPPFPQLKK